MVFRLGQALSDNITAENQACELILIEKLFFFPSKGLLSAENEDICDANQTVLDLISVFSFQNFSVTSTTE